MKHIGAILDSLPRRWPTQTAVEVAWRLTAGPALAEQATVGALRDGVLHLHVRDTAGERQIASLRPELIGGLNARLGPGTIRGMSVHVGPRHAAAGA